jgi:hypothetical protein
MATQEQNPTIHDQLADLTETMQRGEITLTPEVKKYFDEQMKKFTEQMSNGKMPNKKELKAFIIKIKRWIKMPKRLREELPSIELMENPRLTKELKERLIAILEARFKPKNSNRHKGLEWTKVKDALEANEKAMWSINKMEEAGHEPDVYNYDDNGFDIGTCSSDVPESGRGCVYDAEASIKLQAESPHEKFNGSAVEMAEEMMIELMSPEQYKNLQTKGVFDFFTWSWLKTPDKVRKSGRPFAGSYHEGEVQVRQHFADSPNDKRGWRGTLRVPWKK